MKIAIRERQFCWFWLELALVLGLSSAAYLALPEAISAGEPSTGAAIRIRVTNYTQASDSLLGGAEREANRIFAQARLAVVWRNCPIGPAKPVEPDPCHDAPEPTDIVLRILSAPTDRQFQDNVFGFAVHPLLASVYYDRVLLRAVRDTAQFEVHLILGAVMAHEIGHLLIGSNAHSSSGVMQASWERKQIRQAVTGTLYFTAEQARLIRAETEARAKLQAAIPRHDVGLNAGVEPQSNLSLADPFDKYSSLRP